MPLHDTTAFSGTVGHVFAHRFTVEADGETISPTSARKAWPPSRSRTGCG